MSALSPRQREVLKLAVADLSNAQIAAELGIATGTVQKYFDEVRFTLGAQTRAQAIDFATRAGVL